MIDDMERETENLVLIDARLRQLTQTVMGIVQRVEALEDRFMPLDHPCRVQAAGRGQTDP